MLWPNDNIVAPPVNRRWQKCRSACQRDLRGHWWLHLSVCNECCCDSSGAVLNLRMSADQRCTSQIRWVGRTFQATRVFTESRSLISTWPKDCQCLPGDCRSYEMPEWVTVFYRKTYRVSSEGGLHKSQTLTLMCALTITCTTNWPCRMVWSSKTT